MRIYYHFLWVVNPTCYLTTTWGTTFYPLDSTIIQVLCFHFW